jgi:hypothetical protein
MVLATGCVCLAPAPPADAFSCVGLADQQAEAVVLAVVDDATSVPTRGSPRLTRLTLLVREVWVGTSTTRREVDFRTFPGEGPPAVGDHVVAALRVDRLADSCSVRPYQEDDETLRALRPKRPRMPLPSGPTWWSGVTAGLQRAASALVSA